MKQININYVLHHNNIKNMQANIKLNKVNKWLMHTMFLLLALLSISLQPVFAADVAATVFFKSGNVTANSSERGLRQLEKDDSIYSKDEIDTADNGRAQLRFTDGGLVSLMPGSIFSVEEYLFDDADEKSSAVFGLLKGGLRTVTGAIGKVKHEDYELKTPVATLGIRGTEFTVVLQNADTLLVHVGRGKVVITNDSGSLEVHEGQNAIVRLGNAPEFTDQEPMFLATAPTGDDLKTERPTSQDPHVTDVLTDVPPSLNMVLFHADLEPRILLADRHSNGKVYNVSMSDFSPGSEWSKSVLGSNSDLEWGGFYAAPSATGAGLIGNVDGDSINITDYPQNHEYIPYVSGNAMVDYTPSGTLSYGLASNNVKAYTDMIGSIGDVNEWTVNKFDLGINLASQKYTIDFAITDGGADAAYYANDSGSLNVGSKSQGFGFSTSNITSHPSGSDCLSSSCTLTVDGFLAGSQAQSAGANFKLETTQSGDIHGAVPLTNTGGNTGLGGGGGGAPGVGG